MTSLRERYDEKKRIDEENLHEGIFDAFSSNSQNVQKVRSALQQAKSVAGTYSMKNIQAAVAKAEQNFEQAVASNNAKNKAVVLSNVTVFSDVMSDFFRNMDQWIMQLPTMADALEKAKAPENANKTLGELLKAPADGSVSPPDATNNLIAIVQKQFDKSAGGFLKSVARLFASGTITSSKSALASVGLDSTKVVQDVLGIQANKYNQMLQAAKQVPAVQIQQMPNTPESGTTQTAQSQPAQAAGTPQPTQQTAPPTQASASAGNAQVAGAKPTPAQATERDTKLQSAIRNRNAFNTQVMSSLSNEEIKTDLINLAKALGISLT